jgi:hypothetical protein
MSPFRDRADSNGRPSSTRPKLTAFRLAALASPGFVGNPSVADKDGLFAEVRSDMEPTGIAR